jgi:hypothetical protein
VSDYLNKRQQDGVSFPFIVEVTLQVHIGVPIRIIFKCGFMQLFCISCCSNIKVFNQSALALIQVSKVI